VWNKLFFIAIKKKMDSSSESDNDSIPDVEKNRRRLNVRSEQTEQENRQPFGFTRPLPLSIDLCNFLFLEPGAQMSRVEVTREINNYIRRHNLQDPVNRRNILVDERLRTIIDLEPNQRLSFFNMQRYLFRHFLRPSQN
jgi:upstream activation factor subunit UAF30